MVKPTEPGAAVIDLERDHDVFILHMRGGENRVDLAFLSEFGRALDEVDAFEGPAALVTTGTGHFYSTGLDLEGLVGGNPGEAQEVLSALHRLFARLLVFPRATVAAVNGHAFAAGAMLAMAQDFRIMRSDRGFFCIPEIDLATGQPLTSGMIALLDARLPRASFHEAVVTGRRYTAVEAVAHAFVHESLPEAEVLGCATERARALAGKDRATMAALKGALFESVLEALSAPQISGGR